MGGGGGEFVSVFATLRRNIWTDFHEISLQWCHNGRNGVSNYRRLDCVLNRLSMRRPKIKLKLRFTGLYEGNSLVTGEFPAQKASNAGNVSIWWRHLVSVVYSRDSNSVMQTAVKFGEHLHVMTSWWFLPSSTLIAVLQFIMSHLLRFPYLDAITSSHDRLWDLDIDLINFHLKLHHRCHVRIRSIMLKVVVMSRKFHLYWSPHLMTSWYGKLSS